MLPVLLLITLFMSLALLLLRRDLRSVLLFLAVGSITFFLYTISVYIAKKGGITDFTTLVLYGNKNIRQILMYQVFTMNKLGIMMSLGRYLSPYFILLSSLNMTGKLDESNILIRSLLLAIIPIFAIIIYIPNVFEIISSYPSIMKFFIILMKIWILVYLSISVLIMVYELWSNQEAS